MGRTRSGPPVASFSGKYEILEKIGKGGMGEVYKARHVTLETVRALKILPHELAEDADLVARFQREARVMAQLRHENIVKVFDLAREGDVYYLVEEYIDGPNLNQYIKQRGALPPQEALDIARQLGAALLYAHDRQVVHRDIKPGNVLIEAGPPLRVVLTDFGIAKLVNATDQTRTGMLLGSLKYSAPEQMGYRRGPRGGQRVELDGRADIFSFGLVMYEMLQGEQFFAGAEQTDILYRLLSDPDPLVPRFSASVPSDVAAIVERAIQRDPEGRYQNMSEMLAALERCLSPFDASDAPTMRLEFGTTTTTDDELRERIESLERERRRRSALGAQARTKAARDAAAIAEAAQHASSLFDEARAKEDRAAAALAESRFGPASELFEQAAESFIQAAAEASAARRSAREAELLHAEVVEARGRAEKERAADLASTIWRRASTLENEGLAHGERRAWDDARRAYVDARHLYQDAAEAAGRIARERAAAAEAALKARVDATRESALRDRAAAESAGAPQHAAARHAQALEALAGAEAARESGKFDAAVEGYERAAAALRQAQADAVEARRRADEERARQRARAEELRAVAEAAAAAADSAGAGRYAAEVQARGVALAERGRTALDRGDHAAAIEALHQAAATFRDAATRAASARAAEQASEARGEARARKAEAEHDGARDIAPTAWRRAVAAEEHADRARRSGDHTGARDGYCEAARLYAEARTGARRVAEQRAAARARDTADAERKAAVTALAPDLAAERFAEAERQRDQAVAMLGAESFPAAADAFAQAGTGYRLAKEEALREVARRRAMAASDAARDAERRAGDADAGRHAVTALEAARRAQSDGVRALDAGDHEAAGAAFARAAALFDHAAAEADERRAAIAEQERAEARRAAVAARAEVVAAEREARLAGAADVLGERFRAAAGHIAEGDEALAETRLLDARTLFHDTAAELHRLAQEARRIGEERAEARRAADAARAEMLAAEREARLAGAADVLDEPFRTAARQIAQGDEALAETRILDATTLFHDTAAELHRLAEEARRIAEERAEARRAADAARAEMLAAEREARLAGAADVLEEPFRAASRHIAEGDEALAETRLLDATTVFQDTAAELHRLAEEARRIAEERTRRVIPPASPETKPEPAVSEPAVPGPAAPLGDETVTLAPPPRRTPAPASPAVQVGPPPPEPVPPEPVPPARRAAATPSRTRAVAAAAALVVVGGVAAWYAVGPHAPSAVAPAPRSAALPAPPATAPVAAPPTPAPPAPVLAWRTLSPSDAEREIKPDDRLHLSAEVDHAAGTERVEYAWWVGADERGHGASWDFVPRADDAGRTSDVRVVASLGDRHLEHTWRIHVDRPPTITAATPDERTVRVTAGGEQRFAVTATDADAAPGERLEYVWQFNGRVVSSGNDPTWVLRAAGEQGEVAVTVKDHVGVVSGPRTWNVVVATPPPAPVVENRPPRIVSRTPASNADLSVDEGGSVDFSVRAEDPDAGDRVSYAWYVDGRQAAEGPSLRLKLPKTSGPGPHRVEAEASDQAAHKSPRVAWNVSVRASAPEIADFEPRTSPISVPAGESRRFSAAPKTGGGDVRLEWTLDGTAAHASSDGRFDLPPTLASGAHDLAVAAVDPEGRRSTPHRWTVNVEAKAPPPPAPAPPPAAVATAAGISEADARQWLAHFLDAWQQKDVPALRRLGVINTPGQEEKLRSVLKQYREYHVTVRNERIRVDGAHATLTFERSDSDETGKSRPAFEEVYHLAKGPDGVVTALP